MSESLPILCETADRLFADLASDEAGGFARAWAAVGEAGFPALLVPEDQGGFGGDWADAFAVMRLCGVHALAAPLAEAVLAEALAAEAGLAPGSGLVTLAPRAEGEVAAGRFAGALPSVPYGRHAQQVVAQVGRRLIRLRVADATVTTGENPAGEPRDGLRFEGAPVESAPFEIDLQAFGALARTAQIAGALDAALELSIGHANERVQFGKPIGKFQAVQQSLAVFAEAAAAVNCAGQAAARAADRGEAELEIAAAKLCANRAAGVGAAIAHQVHGAIGFTLEHRLHRFTRRLVAWRSEFGTDRVWAERLGAAAAAAGPEGLWPMLTARSDAAWSGDSHA